MMSQFGGKMNLSTNFKRSVTRASNYSNVVKAVFLLIVTKFKKVIEKELILKPEK